jgi:hypothetical protein
MMLFSGEERLEISAFYLDYNQKPSKRLGRIFWELIAVVGGDLGFFGGRLLVCA